MGLFIDIHQYHRIGQVQGDASSARTKADRAESGMKDLERRTDRLALACQALLEILQERAGITEDEVRAKMEEIDLRDGRADGKISHQAAVCAGCGKTIGSQRAECMYCGHHNRPTHTVA
jgi:VIT1/CCC1 family predicted Fe2+/Mn2+ transporter